MSVSKRTTRPRRGFTLLEIMIIVGIIGILIAIAIPSWIRARSLSAQRSCQENLTKIDGAKEQWALENQQGGVVTPVDADLYGESRYVRASPMCPSGGSYTIGNLQTRPSCSEDTAATFPHVFTVD